MATGLLDEIVLGVKNTAEELAERRAKRYAADEVDDRFYEPRKPTKQDVEVTPFFKPVVDPFETVTPSLLNLSDLEGKPYLTTMYDRTAASGNLVGIGDKELAYPIKLTGGQDYMYRNPNQIGASNENVVDKVYSAAKGLKDKYGENPLFMPVRMTPTGSDFASEMTAGTMMSYAAKNMSARDRKRLNKEIKELIPDFVGVESPFAPQQVQSQPDFLRKRIQQKILDKNYRDLGGLSLGQARLAIADQSQLNAPVLGFQNVGLLDVDKGPLLGQGNLTYPVGIAGEPVGRLVTDATLPDLNPTNVYQGKGRDSAFGAPLDVNQFGEQRSFNDMRRSAELNLYGGIIDDKLLRNLEDKGIPTKNNPLLTIATVGLGLYGSTASSEAEAGVLSGTQKTISRLLDDYDKIRAGGKSGLLQEPYTFKDLTTQVETEIFNALRKQNETFGNKVFDRYKVGPETNIAGSERVKGIARYAMPRPYSEELTRVRLSNPDVIEIKPDAVGARQFYNSITAAKEANKFGAAVEAYKPSQYRNMRLFLTEDGTAGFALKPDGDLVSAFSDGSNKGVASQIMLLAIEQGAKKLDAFDTILPDLYAQFGFREASRVKFDPDQAPADFDYSPEGVFGKYNRGQPDISFMTYQRGDAVPLQPTIATSYEEALGMQSQALNALTDPLNLSRRKNDLAIFPAPQRMFDPMSRDYKQFLSKYEFQEGGRYIAMNADLADVTGMFPKQARISIDPSGKPTFNVSNVSRKGLPPVEGNTVRTNLFKKSAGWNWETVPDGYPSDPAGNFPIISVEDSKGHYYALSTDYPEGVMLQRNPATSEPRLRPETKGFVEYGNVVGQIRTRKSKANPEGKLHNVYDKITIRNVAPAIITGFAAASQSEEADASYVSVVSKLGFGRKDLLETAKRMEKQGASNAEIWSKTGWERNQADGKWITELPNTETKLNMDALRSADLIAKSADGTEFISKDYAYKSDYAFLKVRDILDSPELLDQYEPKSGRRLPMIMNDDDVIVQQGSRSTIPRLGDIKIVIDDGYEPASGAYDGRNIYIGNNSTLEEVRGILLHELQHAIQDHEGFGTGTSVSHISHLRNKASAARPELIAVLEGEVEFLNGRLAEANKNFMKTGLTQNQMMEAKMERNYTKELRQAKLDELERLRKNIRLKEYFDDIAFEINPNNPDSVSSHAIYSVFSGEVQARNVEVTDKVRRITSGELKRKGPPTKQPYEPPFDPETTPPSERDAFTTMSGNFTTLPQDKQIAIFNDVEEEIASGQVKNVPRLDKEYTTEEYDQYLEDAASKNDKVLSKAKPVLDGLSQSTSDDFYTDIIAGPYSRPPSKIEADMTIDVFKFIARTFEDAAKMIYGAGGSTVDPESGKFEKVMSTPSIFGEYNESSKQVMSKIGSQLGKVIKPAVNVVLDTRSPISGTTLREAAIRDLEKVQDIYYSLPETVQEEIAPRIGYATLGALGALTFMYPTPKPKPDVQVPLRPDEGLLQLAN